MQQTNWILIDTETTGFAAPIFVVEIAAQRMRSWEPIGEPFQKLLNQNRDIPQEASRVHGYTREILERDGEPAQDVYAAFASYAGSLPLVAYNLEYDLERVLLPEWERIGIAPIGGAGFCALRLAQRLLDPVPAGNCKLQTLRQYYRLPERGAHTGLGDVMTVVDLFGQVLRPIAEQRGLHTWDDIVRHATEEWYPSRISFGKFKGRSIFEARKSPEIRQWLDWLANSSNARSAQMGRWYLREVEQGKEPGAERIVTFGEGAKRPRRTKKKSGATAAGMIVFVHPDLKLLKELVSASRARLADLEATYTSDKAGVSTLQASLFKQLRPHYEERDRVRLVVSYRRSFLDTLLRQGEDEAKQLEEEFRQAEGRTRREYQETGAAMESKRQLSQDEEGELKRIRSSSRTRHTSEASNKCRCAEVARISHELLRAMLKVALAALRGNLNPCAGAPNFQRALRGVFDSCGGPHEPLHPAHNAGPEPPTSCCSSPGRRAKCGVASTAAGAKPRSEPRRSVGFVPCAINALWRWSSLFPSFDRAGDVRRVGFFHTRAPSFLNS